VQLRSRFRDAWGRFRQNFVRGFDFVVVNDLEYSDQNFFSENFFKKLFIFVLNDNPGKNWGYPAKRNNGVMKQGYYV
jgi:hypothetical protein